MTISLELFYESFLAGLALILTSQGLIFILITLILCVFGIFLRSRAPAQLSLILILLVCVLNLHVFAIFPFDETAKSLTEMSGQPGPVLERVQVILAKILYNLGLVLIPFIIYMVSLSLTGQAAPED